MKLAEIVQDVGFAIILKEYANALKATMDLDAKDSNHLW